MKIKLLCATLLTLTLFTAAQAQTLDKAKLDLAAVYTNDFVKKANAKYPKG